jgi:GAF domain-containing protein
LFPSAPSRTTTPFVILDTHLDWRFARHPYVIQGLAIRFYAGVPLKSEEGHSLGSLCIIDNKPRTSFSEEESQTLEDLGALAMREIELYTVSFRLMLVPSPVGR